MLYMVVAPTGMCAPLGLQQKHFAGILTTWSSCNGEPFLFLQ